VNKLYKKSGHLWEGRFKSCLVQSEQYVLACYRYIELNPVRAVLAGRAGQNRGASYPAHAPGGHSDLLTPHQEDLNLRRANEKRQAGFSDPLRLVLRPALV